MIREKQHRQQGQCERFEQDEAKDQRGNCSQQGPDVGNVIQKERQQCPCEPEVNTEQQHDDSSTDTRAQSNTSFDHHVGVDAGFNLVTNHLHTFTATARVRTFNSTGQKAGFKNDENQEKQDGNTHHEQHSNAGQHAVQGFHQPRIVVQEAHVVQVLLKG